MIFQICFIREAYGIYSLSILSCYVSNYDNGTTVTGTILERVKEYDDNHAWLRRFVIPEEDRHIYTSLKWAGEYRWFRASKIVCLEKARLVRQQDAERTAA
jgi:hypothetical protein